MNAAPDQIIEYARGLARWAASRDGHADADEYLGLAWEACSRATGGAHARFRLIDLLRKRDGRKGKRRNVALRHLRSAISLSTRCGGADGGEDFALSEAIAGRYDVDPAEAVRTRVDSEAFFTALDARDAALLRLIGAGYLYREAAEAVGLSESRVCQRLHGPVVRAAARRFLGVA